MRSISERTVLDLSMGTGGRSSISSQTHVNSEHTKSRAWSFVSPFDSFASLNVLCLIYALTGNLGEGQPRWAVHVVEREPFCVIRGPIGSQASVVQKGPLTGLYAYAPLNSNLSPYTSTHSAQAFLHPSRVISSVLSSAISLSALHFCRYTWQVLGESPCQR